MWSRINSCHHTIYRANGSYSLDKISTFYPHRMDGCAAVYAASIGANSVRRLMKAGIQPIVVDEGHDIVDLLNEVSLALVYGGLPWVDKAKKKAEAQQAIASEPASAAPASESRKLIASVEELD